MTKVCVQLGYYGVDSLDEIKELKDEWKKY
jgi:hypothetical protein